MLGSLLSSAIKVVTLPIDAANSAMDIATGGDGTKESRNGDILNPLSDLEKLRDNIADAAKEIDN